MPGRFTLTTDSATLRDALPWLEVPDGVRPRYNVAPSQPVAVLTNEGKQKLDFFTWGLVPSWVSGTKMTSLLINARGESLAKKRTFRPLYLRKRCLVFADGVFEWLPEKQGRKKVKIPYYYYLKSRQPFAFAGLWDSWQSIDGSEIKSCCIITVEPNELIRTLHHRMGAILHSEDYETWLTPGELPPSTLDPLLAAYPDEEFAYHRVSTLVNKTENDNPECIEPVEEEPQQRLL